MWRDDELVSRNMNHQGHWDYAVGNASAPKVQVKRNEAIVGRTGATHDQLPKD